jgi:hypothetical protein
VSAAALIAVTRMDAAAAAPRSRSKTAAPGPDSDAAEPKSAPRKSAPPKPAPAPPPKITTASLDKDAPAAATTTPTMATIAPAKSAGGAVTLPEWKGKRLSVVRREARKLGLNVTAVTGGGDSVPSDEASGYRVRKQLTVAGTEVEPGTNVEVRVREIVDTAEGY